GWVERGQSQDPSDAGPDEDDEDGPPPSDTRPDTRPPGGGFPGENGRVSEGSGVCDGLESRNGVAAEEPRGTECLARVSEPAPGYVLVTDPADLRMLATAVEGTALVRLDCEPTGLAPRADRVRLLSLCCDTTDGGTVTYVLDCFALDPSPLWEALGGRPVVAHNALFDLGMLARLGFVPGE